MLEEFRTILTEVQRLSPEEGGSLEVWVYGWIVVNIVYYILLAIVVLFLGKRLISATFAALHESKRVTQQETPGA